MRYCVFCVLLCFSVAASLVVVLASLRYWVGVDLAVEVVSADDPERDTKVKCHDYAQADIPEYWIVNPRKATITVLVLEGKAYTEYGMFQRGERALSKLLRDVDIFKHPDETCHAERSEASIPTSWQTLRFAQGDMMLAMGYLKTSASLSGFSVDIDAVCGPRR